jgi:MinD superfamily P-loop ATPase
MNLKIAISSGKGGTGKTFVSTNISYVLNEQGKKVTYLDCDVEEPNGHLFLKPCIYKTEDINFLSPAGVDNEKCIKCGECVKACKYNAIALVKEKILFFKNLCHICGACQLVCPTGSIIEKERKIGIINHGKSANIDFHYGLLETGEGGMTPRLIKKVKEYIGDEITILDSPPGTSCPVVETVKNADLCILITDPTPFGINDLKLAVDICREMDQEPVIIVNRAEYLNDDLKNYCNQEQLEIIAEIPDDRKIAECYSTGDLAVEKFPEYMELFKNISFKILSLFSNKKAVIKKIKKDEIKINDAQKIECGVKENKTKTNAKEIVVISGKGGTGKTSIVAGFCALEKNIAISDCDVDAADLHLVLNPQIKDKGSFSGSEIATIIYDKCNSCGQCFDICKFNAIKKSIKDSKLFYSIDYHSCEGCGSCRIICKYNAIKFTKKVNGEWFVSDTRFGPMSHAKLGIAEENSGKLVTLIRNKKTELAAKFNLKESIIDGSPGTGCPVIASLTGTDYAVIVTEPTVSGVHDLKRILDVVKFFNIRSGIIVNKYDLNFEKTKEIKEITNYYSTDFLGTVPYDKSITEAQIKKLSVIEYTDNIITESIKNIWKNIKDIIDKKN